MRKERKKWRKVFWGVLLIEELINCFVFLFQCGKNEESLTIQLTSLRDQCNLKKSSLQDHVSTLEILRDEVSIIKYLVSNFMGDVFSVEKSIPTCFRP